MQCSDIVLWFRLMMAEPYQTRWVDTPGVANSTLLLASVAQKDVARETRWLRGRKLLPVQAGIGEYKMTFERVAIERAYMLTASGPQRLRPTTKAQMTGDQLRLYDSTGANFTPQWQNIPAAPYPVSNAQVGPGWFALPMFPGAAPQYYIESDLFGIVPMPSAPYNIYLDIRDMPGDFVNLEQLSPFHMDWREAIGWKMCALAYFSDQDETNQGLANAEYDKALAKLHVKASNDNEEDPEGPQILTHRTFYSAGKFGGFN
jgi:hypothetical protein